MILATRSDRTELVEIELRRPCPAILPLSKPYTRNDVDEPCDSTTHHVLPTYVPHPRPFSPTPLSDTILDILLSRRICSPPWLICQHFLRDTLRACFFPRFPLVPSPCLGRLKVETGSRPARSRQAAGKRFGPNTSLHRFARLDAAARPCYSYSNVTTVCTAALGHGSHATSIYLYIRIDDRWGSYQHLHSNNKHFHTLHHV